LYFTSPCLEATTDAELDRWLERAGPYVESIRAGSFFNTIDRIALFGSLFSRTPYLKELNVVSETRSLGAVGNTLGDVLLYSLTSAPSLEKLQLYGVSFSSPVIVERFLASSNTLRCLYLNQIKALDLENKKVEAVGRAFRRGVERNRTLRAVHITFRSGETNEILLREIAQGVLKNGSIQDLSLSIHGPISDHSLTVLRILVSGLSTIRKLHFSGSVALVALFQGLASCSVSIDELQIEPVSSRGDINFEDPSTDNRVAGAIREWNGSKEIIKTLVCTHGRQSIGPTAGAAFADSIAHMMADATLENVSVDGVIIPATLLGPILRRMDQLQSAKLARLTSNNWATLTNLTRNQRECKLTEFELTNTSLSENDLRLVLEFLSRIKCLEKVHIERCGITAEKADLVAGFIQQNESLRELDLARNPVGTQGAKVILEAIHSSASKMERLALDTKFVSDESQFCINSCGEVLRDLLVDSRLVDLELSSSIIMKKETVELLAYGLRQNKYLKKLCVPYIKTEDLALLAGCLVENRVLEVVEIGFDGNLECEEGEPAFDEANEAEEQAMCAFIDLLPKMALKKIDNLFDRKPTKRLIERVIAAMQVNTILEEVHFDDEFCARHLFGNATVQYYLELNRLHRRQYLASIGDKTLPSSLLPHILAKMTRPVFSDHLFYYLRSGASLLQSKPSATNASSSLKRKATSSLDVTK
jgi:hypothetical protein